MRIRLILAACITGMACGLAFAASASGHRDRPVIRGSVPNPAKTETSRRATQIDVSRLKRLTVRPAVKCARVEYIHQCLSSQNMTLVRAHCRVGSTEASCCRAIRNYVTSHICGPIWDRFKKAGKSYYPGIFLCKCIETVKLRRLKPGPRRPGVKSKFPPDPIHPPEPVGKKHPPDPGHPK